MFEFKSQISNTPTLIYFSKFLIFIILFQSTVFIVHSNIEASQMVQIAITNVVAYVYQLLADPVIIDGNTLKHVNSSRFLIVDNECTGLILLASVCAVVMAFNYSWQAKLKMIVMAILILQSENIIRITHLLFVLTKENSDFDIYHLYIWQVINFITALFVIGAVERFFRDQEL